MFEDIFIENDDENEDEDTRSHWDQYDEMPWNGD